MSPRGIYFSLRRPHAHEVNSFLGRTNRAKKGRKGLFLRFLREANINGLEKHLYLKAQSKYFFYNNLV